MSSWLVVSCHGLWILLSRDHRGEKSSARRERIIGRVKKPLAHGHQGLRPLGIRVDIVVVVVFLALRCSQRGNREAFVSIRVTWRYLDFVWLLEPAKNETDDETDARRWTRQWLSSRESL